MTRWIGGGGNVQAPAFLPIEVWNNGDDNAPQWGVKYSNGMIMAWGILPGNSVYGLVTITFIKPFTKYYSLTIGTDYGTSPIESNFTNTTANIPVASCYNAAGVSTNHTLTNFRIQGQNKKNWFACGF